MRRLRRPAWVDGSPAQAQAALVELSPEDNRLAWRQALAHFLGLLVGIGLLALAWWASDGRGQIAE